MNQKRFTIWHAISICFVSVCLVAFSTMVFAAHSVKESERKWCDVVQTINSSYKDAPPERVTERSRLFERRMRELAERLGCDE